MDELLGFLTDDEDFLELIDEVEIGERRRPRVFRERQNHFEKWNNAEFFDRFRLTKLSVQQVLAQINIFNLTERNHAVSAIDMLLLTLRFYATGSMLIVAGDFCGVHKSTASRVVHKVSRAIAELKQNYIKFPQTQEEIFQVRQGFYNICKFPRCIGALDCTHVKIQSPGGDNAEAYRNRKGFFSMNVQGICDSTLKIRSLVARWPGSSHDSTIFNMSIIRNKFENREMDDNLLVGDSGYAILSYLMTPLANPRTAEEVLFNESQIRTRNPIERCFGVWKRRFPVLALGIRLKKEKLEAIIVATAVLHNIACENGENQPPVNDEVEAAVEFVNNMTIGPDIEHRRNILIRDVTRQNLINNYFARLTD